jgi:iron complex outermembrane receptor protein
MSALDRLTVAARRAAALPTFRRGCAIILVLFHSPLLAQPAPLPVGGQDEPVILSPFVIDAKTETGWVATQTLAGSRMKTDFKDLASPVEVMTKDFLDDLGLTNFSQALLYSTSVEGREDIVTGEGFSPGLFQGGPGEATPAGRVRGLAAATMSRDFFEGYAPIDNYNIERITIARGPNAILFGLGSPAGIVDVSSKRGDLRRNVAGVELQWSSEDSRRSAFDLNRVLVKDRLALRFDAMAEEESKHVKPNLHRQERLYGAITARPFKGTTVSLNAERARLANSDSPRVLPSDGYTVWENADRIPGSPYASGRPLFDNRTIPANIATANPVFSRGGAPAVLLQNAGAISGNLQGWNNSVVAREAQGIPDPFNPFNSFDRFAFSVPNDKVVPFDVNTVGSSRSDHSQSDRFGIFIEHEIADKLFLEVAYNQEDYHIRMADAGGFPSAAPLVQVDANLFLPDGLTRNPNVGRFYIQGSALGREYWQERQDARATMSYEFDAARRLKDLGVWSKWLGRHRVAGLISRADTRARDQQVARRFLDSTIAIPGVTMPTGSAGTGPTGTGARNWASSANRNFTTRFYIDEPRGSRAYIPFGPADGTWFFTDSAGRQVGAYLFDSPYRTADGIKLVPGSGAAGSKSTVDSQMLAWQGYFLRDRLVLLYGYRKDTAKSASLDARYQTVDWSGLTPSAENADFGSWGPEQTGSTRTRGAILHLTEWASLGYSKSNTFQLNIGRFDPFGNEYPGASGEADDLSVNFSFLRRKLTLRAARFTNTAGPTRAGNAGFNDPIRTQLFNLDNQIRTLDPSLPTINVGSGGFRDRGQPNYRVMNNAQAKGYELEIGWNPTPNWSFRANAAKQDVVETDIGTAWFAWTAARLPVWQSLSVPEGGKSTPSDVNGDGRIGIWTWATAPMPSNIDATRTTQRYYEELIVAQSLAFIHSVEGRQSAQARGWRGNLIGQYRVGEGRFKGLFTNAALRFRGPPTIGFGAKTLPSGVLAYDVNQTIKGQSETICDLGLGYRGRLRPFGGLRYRAQLNVRNVLGSDDLLPVKALTTGEFVRYARVEPRTFVFTFAVEY